MSKVHINAFTRCQPFQVSWTSISHWHDTDLRHFGNDGNTAFNVLRMTASTWEHNQRTVALFQHIDRILNGFCSRIFTVDRKCPTHANPPAKNTIGEEFFFRHKDKLLWLGREGHIDRIPPSPVRRYQDVVLFSIWNIVLMMVMGIPI